MGAGVSTRRRDGRSVMMHLTLIETALRNRRVGSLGNSDFDSKRFAQPKVQFSTCSVRVFHFCACAHAQEKHESWEEAGWKRHLRGEIRTLVLADLAVGAARMPCLHALPPVLCGSAVCWLADLRPGVSNPPRLGHQILNAVLARRRIAAALQCRGALCSDRLESVHYARAHAAAQWMVSACVCCRAS